MTRRKSTRRSSLNSRSGLSATLRKPAVQLAMVAFIALIVYLIASAGGNAALAREVNVAQAYEMYQQDDVFVLDVRTQQEWDEYHAPNTTLIPLDQLQARINEVPKDKEILIVCRSGNRSQEARDILLAAGYNATSMSGGLLDWRANGYPVESGQ